MRILFDQGTPAPLRRALAAHHVSTAYEMGWAELANGALLAAAEVDFDILVTTDKNLRHQQTLDRQRLAILILPTTNWPEIRMHEKLIVDTVKALRPGEVIALRWS
jgi:predicted nuclease of predicted toxin-antitoxin system